MKTMSDFIMEQEIADLNETVSDAQVMEGFMQMNAIAAVANCYCEHANIAQFATETGLNVFSESDDNIVKKAWNSVKGFFEKIWDWLKMVVKAIIQMVTRSKLEKCIAKIKRWSADGTDDEGRKFNLEMECGISSVIIDANNVLELIEEFSNCIKAGYTKDGLNDKLEGFTKSAKEFVEKFKKNKKKNGSGWEKSDYRDDSRAYYDARRDEFREDFREGFTRGSKWGEVLETLENMQKKNTSSSAHKLLKSLDFKKKEWHDKDTKTDSSDVKKVNEAAKWIAKAYDKYTNYTVKMVQKLLKERIREEHIENVKADTSALRDANKLGGDYQDKEAAKKKKETQESYQGSTDGYFFL